MTHQNIHEAIAAVMGEVGYVTKTRSREGGVQYSYAGEAALIEALRPAMVTHGIYVSVSEVSDVRHETYTTSKGGSMNRVTLAARVRFTFTGGDYIEVMAVGEGADVGDKSSQKAMTSAYKYALRQTFCIETGDDPDKYPSDDQERASKPSPAAQRVPVDSLPDQYEVGKVGNYDELSAAMVQQKPPLRPSEVLKYCGGAFNKAAVNEWMQNAHASTASVIAGALAGRGN